jgi:uncharacterized membrane protein
LILVEKQKGRGGQMWGCNFYSDMPFTGPFLSQGFFSVLLPMLLLFIGMLFILYLHKKAHERNKSSKFDNGDSMEILKIRYAKGEISGDQFRKIKQALL